MNVKQYLDWATNYFNQHDLYYGHGTDNPWDEAVMLLMHALKLDRDPGREILDQELSKTQAQQLLKLSKKRVTDLIPVPYLTNTAWYMGEKYYVTKDVIIPRSPIAELIKNKFKTYFKQPPKRILDLCCGSACIAIACAKVFKDAHIDAVDISTKALKVAERNINLHKCKTRVKLIKSDLFNNLSARDLKKKYDLIITNPPYVSAKDLSQMPAEYKHEPALSLGSGTDGLDLTRKIISAAKEYLVENGVLIIEVGNSWKQFEKAFKNIKFKAVELKQGGIGVYAIMAKDLP